MAVRNSEWSRKRVEQTAHQICDPAAIQTLLSAGQETSPAAVRDMLYQARSLAGLELAQVATLIQITDPALRAEIKQTARSVHQEAYGRRVGLFAPVCPTNRCVDDCLYCPLRRSNSILRRTKATAWEVQREVSDLLGEGHRRLILVFGNDRSGVPYLQDMLEAAYGARNGLRQAQRVDLNLDPLPLADLRELCQGHSASTYHTFQETYDPQAYATLHPSGPKSDYAWRLTSQDRSYEAGFDDVGLGVLLGAGPYPFDVVAVLSHAQHLRETHGHGPHTITYPRLLAARGAPASQEPERQISDEDFTFIVAVTRLAAPYTGIIMSTPAESEVRRELYDTGVSEVTVGAPSYPGVYTENGRPEAGGRLVIARARPLETIIYRLCELGFVPNFCTHCYSQRRRRALAGEVGPVALTHEYCVPNALLTLKEYLMDYAGPQTQTVVGRLLQNELAHLPEQLRTAVLERMEEIEDGLRDEML